MATSKKPAAKKPEQVFSDVERQAMKDHIKEQKAAAKRGNDRAEWEKDLLAKIAEMSPEDRKMGKRIHEIVTTNAPDLLPKTWYGMPAYFSEGQAVCFFQPADKFKARYATFGFNDSAKLDDGGFWPTSYALKELDEATEKKIVALVKKAVR